MLSIGQDELICDFAEYYHIYNIFNCNCEYISILASGLRSNSRIVQKMNNVKIDINTLLLAHIADRESLNLWSKTKDGRNNKNRPRSFVDALTKTNFEEKRKFNSGADFMAEWRRLNNA